MDVVESAGQPAGVAIERPAAEPGVAGPAVPGDDPVVQREPQRRQVLVGRGDGRQAFEHGAQVVAEEADETAEERRGVRGHERSPVQAGDEPACDGERVRSGGR